MSEPRTLRDSRRLCGQICRRSNSSFWTSFALLDRPRRQAMCALYAFARITDDLGDCAAAVEIRTAKLADWRNQLWRHCAATRLGEPCDDGLSRRGKPCDDGSRRGGPCDSGAEGVGLGTTTATIWPAVYDCIKRYHIPLAWLDDIITGVTMDLTPRQPSNWTELEHYCYHVASSVGLACTQIWRSGAATTVPPVNLSLTDTASPARQAAIDCGIAFQLTNILRDIAEDARQGRIYVPHSLFAEYQVHAVPWLAGQPTGDWEAMLDHMAQQAREFYCSGWQTIDDLTPPSQRMFSLMWRSYRGLLERVTANKHRLWSSRRIRLASSQRLSLLTTHFVSPMYARLSPPC